jgi:hypothetical protein
MTSRKWKQSAEFLGVAAILVGLFFVYQEIKLNSTIARAELSANTVQRRAELGDMLFNPEFVELYLKGLRAPAELSEIERWQLSRFFRAQLSTAGYELRMYRLGLFAEFTAVTRGVARNYFASGYGKIWWNASKDNVIPELVAVIDEELSKWDGTSRFLDFDKEVVRRLETATSSQ